MDEMMEIVEMKRFLHFSRAHEADLRLFLFLCHDENHGRNVNRQINVETKRMDARMLEEKKRNQDFLRLVCVILSILCDF